MGITSITNISYVIFLNALTSLIAVPEPSIVIRQNGDGYWNKSLFDSSFADFTVSLSRTFWSILTPYGCHLKIVDKTTYLKVIKGTKLFIRR